jgi:uncharacterized protein YjiS (DUF1127 family)
MLHSLIRMIQAFRDYQRDVAELSQLSDRELADIGLDRSDIPRVAARTYTLAPIPSAVDDLGPRKASLPAEKAIELTHPRKRGYSHGCCSEERQEDVFADTATARNGDFDVTLPPNQAVSIVLKKTGAVDYYCRFHPNMKALLKIEP